MSYCCHHGRKFLFWREGCEQVYNIQQILYIICVCCVRYSNFLNMMALYHERGGEKICNNCKTCALNVLVNNFITCWGVFHCQLGYYFSRYDFCDTHTHARRYMQQVTHLFVVCAAWVVALQFSPRRELLSLGRTHQRAGLRFKLNADICGDSKMLKLL